MNNILLCSTGVMVGRANLWNEKLISEYCREIEADAFELMMVNAFYEKGLKVLHSTEASNCRFPIIHAEKDIGIFLADDDINVRKKGISLFEFNCKMGVDIGAQHLVFHLWSGGVSDTKLDNNISMLDELYAICDKYRLKLLIENVPCVKNDPVINFNRVLEHNSQASFVYDMRFGGFHEQNEFFLSSGWLSGAIEHVHVSGYIGPARDFSSLRPILHLNDPIGKVDYSALLPILSSRYDKTITNESPAIKEKGCGLDEINRDMRFLREKTSGSDKTQDYR